MTYEERTKLEGELMTRGIFLSDFISSSTYNAVVKILHESKQASTNTLLAVSGLPEFEFVNKIFIEKYPEYDMRSRLHTVELNEVKLIDVLYDYFEALKAACASGVYERLRCEH